jgi:hypothetical protein
LKEGSTIAIVGFPGKHRKELDEGISYGRNPYIGFASSICGYKFLVDFTRMMTLEGELVFKRGQKNYGGVSGGPCFIVRPDYEPFLIGFVTDHLSFGSVDDNFIKITMSTCINEDGTINRC